MDRENVRKKSYLPLYILAFLAAVIAYFMGGVILNIIKALIKLLIQYWYFLILGFLGILILRKLLFRKKR